MKTKQEWLFQLRKCTSRDTLEKVIEINRYKLPLSESEAFYSAADHRRAELVMNKGVSLEIGNYCTFSALFNQVNP